MLSFWEVESFLRYDTIIIGSGIVGLSTAISLKRNQPDKSVLVLERGLFPTGASTRNAGFACFGSLTELLSDVASIGLDQTFLLVEKRVRGLDALRQRLGDKTIGYQGAGGYELIFESQLEALAHIDRVNEWLRAIFPEPTYHARPDLLRSFGFGKHLAKALVYNPYEGHLHTGQLMRALLQLAQAQGVEIRTGAEVMAIEETEAHVRVWVRDQARNKVPLEASRVAVCTNAFTQQLVSDVRILPGRGQVILTKPLSHLPWRGAFHFDEGFYYFRDVGNRILFGGGRNLAFEEERSDQLGANTRIIDELERLLREVILPGQPFEIEQHWSGIMGFSQDKQPIVQMHSPRLALGFACNGMGVSLATVIGDEVAALLSPIDA